MRIHSDNGSTDVILGSSGSFLKTKIDLTMDPPRGRFAAFNANRHMSHSHSGVSFHPSSVVSDNTSFSFIIIGSGLGTLRMDIIRICLGGPTSIDGEGENSSGGESVGESSGETNGEGTGEGTSTTSSSIGISLLLSSMCIFVIVTISLLV